jgi:hypothetical protein
MRGSTVKTLPVACISPRSTGYPEIGGRPSSVAGAGSCVWTLLIQFNPIHSNSILFSSILEPPTSARSCASASTIWPWQTSSNHIHNNGWVLATHSVRYRSLPTYIGSSPSQPKRGASIFLNCGSLLSYLRRCSLLHSSWRAY